jgi:hypothetical protein
MSMTVVGRTSLTFMSGMSDIPPLRIFALSEFASADRASSSEVGAM